MGAARLLHGDRVVAMPGPIARVREREVSQPSPVASFGLLGSLEVFVGGRAVLIPGGKLRTLLAVLLLRANEVVPVHELGDALWGDDLPGNPRPTIQKYVMRMRRLLEPTGNGIHTEVEGYRIDVRPDQVDLHGFGVLAERGRRCAEAGDWGVASTLLAEAIALWRAVPPLADVRSELVQRDEVPRIVERYLQAVELRVEADMRLGRHAELCEELLGLVRRHPLRERFWEQRMRALYADHRQGEALAAYREVTRHLADELGIDPGPGLQSVHRQILAGSPAIPPPMSSAKGAAKGSRRFLELPVRQLPMATSGVVGRAAEIAEVVRVLSPAREEGRPRLVVVNGPGGVGKSTVAVHAAHHLAGAFPDGQLYAEIRDDTDPVRRVAEVLGYFLRALGMPADAVPSRGEDAIAAFRTMTADRRLLVVLDGAPGASAVRALLPGSGSCAAIVSSRRDLKDLLISPGAHVVSLGTLGPADAHRVLCRALGDARVLTEPDAADELLRRCGGLPLAIRSAAVHLATHPDSSIASYLDEVRSRDPGSPRPDDELCRVLPVPPARTAC